MAHKIWPGKYKSDFAVQVTSSIVDSQQMSVNFSNNKLNGETTFLEGYKSGKTRVCVTVGMMTTGYDCQDILNLAMMRPIFSPTDFVQIKGRGTRKFTFKYTDEHGQKTAMEKAQFKLFDYFANCEYFEEKFNYDEALKLPQQISWEKKEHDSSGLSIEEIEIFDPDKIKTVSEIHVGEEGMRVDREFWGMAKEELSKNKRIKHAVEEDLWEEAEQVIREEYEDRPELYLNLDKIKKYENLDRRLNWKEVLQRMFGLIDRFPNREELLKEECEKFISCYKPESRYVHYIENYLRAYVIDSDFRNAIDQGDLAYLHDSVIFNMEDYKKLNGNTLWQKKVPEYVKNYVNLNTFME